MIRTGLLCAAVFAALLADSPARAYAAGAGKRGDDKRSKATEQTSNRGGAIRIPQWSADPERGWVPADERHQTKSPGNHENKKGKGRGRKF